MRTAKKTNKKAIVRIPASTTNLGPGFDVLGLALQLYSTVTLEVKDTPGTEVIVTGVDTDKIPGTTEHVAFQAAALAFKRNGGQVPPGLKLSIDNGIPAIRGLGGSGTAVLGGLMAANALCDSPMSKADLLNLAAELEGHPDNVAASYLGGLVVCAQEEGHVHTIQLPCPDELSVVLAIPDFTLSTQQARSVLPQRVTLADAIYNTSRSSLLVAAIAAGKLDILQIAMKDRLHQPYRATLIPGFDDVAAAAVNTGAFSVALSGAGPTLAAYCYEHLARQIAQAMQAAFRTHQIQCEMKMLHPDIRGAQIISSE